MNKWQYLKRIALTVIISAFTMTFASAQTTPVSLSFADQNLNATSSFSMGLNSQLSVFAIIQNNTSTSSGNAQTFMLNSFTDNTPAGLTISDNFFPNFGGATIGPQQSVNGDLFDVQSGNTTGKFTGSYNVTYGNSGGSSFTTPTYNYTITVSNSPPVPEASSVLSLFCMGGIGGGIELRRRKRLIRRAN